MKRFYATLVAASLVLSTAVPVLAASVTDSVYGPPPPVCGAGETLVGSSCRPKDVPVDNFAVHSIANMVKSGIMKGDTQGNFMPEKKLNKGETVTVMLRVLGIQPEVGKDQQHWAAPALELAKQAGLVEEPKTETEPGAEPEKAAEVEAEKPMTRADMAVIIAKALKIEPITEAPPWYDAQELDSGVQGYLAALYKAGVFKGYPDNTFKPGQTLTRAELAILVDRILARFKQ